MAKLRDDLFSKEFKENASKVEFTAHDIECALYLEGCLSNEEHERLLTNWKNLGDKDYMPFYKYCMQHIDVVYHE